MAFNLDFVQSGVGILSIALGTASGVAALLFDFKNKRTGKITKWGRYALCGLALSFFIGAVNLWIDYIQKSNAAAESRKKSQEASEQTLQIVTDIGRTLNPLRDVRSSFWVYLPFDGPEISDYRKRLDAGVTALLPQLLDHKVADGVLPEPNPELRFVTISSSSPLYPDFNKERFAYNLFAGTRLHLNFYKEPVDFSSPTHLPIPDILMSFTPSIAEGELYIRYDVKTKALGVFVNNVLSDAQFWNSSGRVVSVLDLAGAKFGLYLANVLFSIDEIKRVWRPELLMLRLGISERRPWFFRPDNLESTKLDRDQWFWVSQYSYQFPNSYSQLVAQMDTTPPLYLHP
jgi:hypothetical protein